MTGVVSETMSDEHVSKNAKENVSMFRRNAVMKQSLNLVGGIMQWRRFILSEWSNQNDPNVKLIQFHADVFVVTV